MNTRKTLLEQRNDDIIKAEIKEAMSKLPLEDQIEIVNLTKRYSERRQSKCYALGSPDTSSLNQVTII